MTTAFCLHSDSSFSLVVSFFFDPSSRGLTKNVLPDFIKDKDQEREGDGREPPVDLQGIHLQSLIHSRSVAQESCQDGFKDETEVHDPVGHTLLEDRVLASFTDDQISPLDNHNGDKEGGVTSVLEDLPLSVGPLLTIGVFQVVDSLGVPSSSDSEQF